MIHNVTLCFKYIVFISNDFFLLFNIHKFIYNCRIVIQLNFFIIGKGNEDKRGQKIKDSGPRHGSWLYVNGHPVICTRHMEVSALVSSINPSINQSSDALEVATLQKNLLWLLYDEGHLSKFPLALGNCVNI